MKFYIVFTTFILIFTSGRTFTISNTSKRSSVLPDVLGNLDSKTSNNVHQSKRDISLSYAATNIDSKEGTRVKTITVIKNLGNKNDKLAINPELHKNDEWATAFRENFDSYGTIPDVPDVDDLFEFVNKKKEQRKEEKDDAKPEAPNSKKPSAEEEKKPSVVESTTTVKSIAAVDDTSAEKIKGDAEIVSSSSKQQIHVQSQSLSLNKPHDRESLIDVNYSTPQHTVRQYFENYIQKNAKGYNYVKPGVHPLPNSASVTSPSGRTYDIPAGGTGGGTNPYIAPAIAKKPQVPAKDNPQTQKAPAANQPTYSVNSIVPPLQASGSSVSITTAPTSQNASQQGAYSTSQRPYVAPSLRNGLGINRGPPPAVTAYRNSPTNFRTNVFGLGANRPNSARSRGLKY